MFETGLVSVSFRSLGVDEIIALCESSGLAYIEWGSDVHAPRTDKQKLEYIRDAQSEKGIRCSSYGTYFKLGRDSTDELYEYISAAKILGCSTLRIWCGEKNYTDMTEDERKYIINEARTAVGIAESCGAVLCCECHGGTFTNTAEGAMRLMEEVGSDAFLMYWQPNQFRSFEENCEYARKIAPYTVNVHVFNWRGNDKYPLADAVCEWHRYLSYFDCSQKLLLEFMPDSSPLSLPREAKTLKELIGGQI